MSVMSFPPNAVNEAARVRMAARHTTPPSILRSLAQDNAVTVRAAVALNASYAPEADRHLLDDPDERVRALLADKLAKLLPGLTGAEYTEAQAHVHATLLALADDAAIRVRAAMAEALATMPEAPREVIMRLAHDDEAAIRDPVLRLSPLLSDDDLLQLLATPALAGSAIAIASRPWLCAEVSDHIARHADCAAVRILLQNQSAAIQESTLDALVGRAADHPDWHEPLARRPCLPATAVRALSRFVASHIIDILAARPELPATLVMELNARTRSGLGPESRNIETDAELFSNVRQLTANGAVPEAALLDALASGSHRQAAAQLSLASGVTLAALDRAIGHRNAKALVSICWKAGLSMRAAMQVQTVIGQLGPGHALAAAQHAAYPLSPEEMEWQIELLAKPGH